MVTQIATPASSAADTRTPQTRSPELQANIDQFSALSAVILDKTGSRSEADKTAAYMKTREMVLAGKLVGSGEEGKVLHNAVFESETGQRIYNLQLEYTQSVNRAFVPGTGQDLGQMMVEAFDTYSAADQAILFDMVISPNFRDSGRRYASETDWRANVRAQSLALAYRAEVESGDEGSRSAEIDALLQQRDVSTPTWTALMLKLLGETPDYRLDLSEHARRLVGERADGEKPAKTYETGSMVSQRI